jgi:hypothetical protein
VDDAREAPRQEYRRRLETRRRSHDALTSRERWLGNGKVVLFVLILLAAWLAFGMEWFSGWWLLVLVVAFPVLLVSHERVTRAWLRTGRAVAFYDRGLARLEDRWSGHGTAGERYLEENHPNAADLDLFGPGSLFELLCTARTRTGEDTLAAWLKAPAPVEEVRARQAAVAELRDQLDLREDLALLGADVRGGVDFAGLVAWGNTPPIMIAWPWKLLVFTLALAAIASLFVWPPWERPAPLLGILLVEGLVALRLRSRVARIINAVERRSRDLALLAGVLGRLERETFQSPRLKALRAALDTTGAAPSLRIAQLCNLIDLLNSRKNQLFAPIALMVMWTTQMAFALEKWRQRTGPSIQNWLAVVGEFEALCAFAAYAYENPRDPFPEIIPEGPCFEGEELGHPLIPVAQCVRNNLRLNRELRVLVVSGSNMSGKSTMLRTVGVNTVLALAGAPVRAGKLRLSPLVVGANLRIQDSLQAGRSRFFAEVLRVRQIVDLSRGLPPLLFLLDEIFHGTNSHDRCQGATAIVRGLVQAGAIGLVTTHDLTLTRIVDELTPLAANVHFEDHFEEEVMHFDYKMRSGVVQHSNALALMRAVGLEV